MLDFLKVKANPTKHFFFLQIKMIYYFQVLPERKKTPKL